MCPQRIIKVERVVESIVNDGFSTVRLPPKKLNLFEKFFSSELMGTVIDHEGLDNHDFQNGDIVEIVIRKIGNINELTNDEKK